jgi:hypothetical protein
MESLMPVLLAHSIAEFILVTDAMPAGKSQSPSKAYTQHAMVIFSMTWIALAGQTGQWGTAFLAGALISMSHVLIEILISFEMRRIGAARYCLKSLFGTVDEGVYLILTGVGTQVAHFLSMLWLTKLMWPPGYSLGTLLQYIIALTRGPVEVPSGDKLLYVLLILVAGSFGVSEGIRVLLKHSLHVPHKTPSTEELIPVNQAAAGMLPPEANSDAPEQAGAVDLRPVSVPAVGRWIGIMERAMIMMLVAVGAWPAVGFIVAAKSMARFKQLDEKEFADYYIAGTLMSSIIGVTFGLLLRYVQ